METLPVAAGTYALALRLAQPAELTVAGRAVRLAPGLYVYVGSAHGPGGLQARLGRHLRGGGRPRWHIDALRAVAEVVGWHAVVSPLHLECDWAQALAYLPGAAIPVPGFGAGDCRGGCQAHLVALPSEVELEGVWAGLDRLAEQKDPKGLEDL